MMSTMAPGEEVCHMQVLVARHLIRAGGVAVVEVAKIEDVILIQPLCLPLVIPYPVEGVMAAVIHHTLQMPAQIVVPDPPAVGSSGF